MRKLVESGNYVTGVSQDANGGLVFTMSNGSPITIGNVINGEKVEAGDKVTFNEETGEILLNGESTGKFVSKTQEGEGKPAEVKVPFVKDGVLYVYNEAGEAEATGIRVNPVTAVQNPETGSWTLTITAADGTIQTIKVPSANTLVTSINVVKAEDAAANFVAPSAANKELVNVSKESYGKNVAVSTYNIDGTKGVYVDVVVTPSSIDAKDLKFKLQNSLGNSVWAEGVVVDNSEALTRAAGVHRVYFAYAKGITQDKVLGDDAIVKNGQQLYVACGNSLSGDIKQDILPDDKISSSVVTPVESFVKVGETYSLFGKAFKEDPSKKTAAYKADQALLSGLTGVTDIKIGIDETRAKEYGIVTEGATFKFTKTEAYGLTDVPFTIYYTDFSSEKGASEEVHSTTLNINVQTTPTASAVTLQSTYKLHVDKAAKMVAYFPIENLVNAINGADKITWNSKKISDIKITSVYVDSSDPTQIKESANLSLILNSAKKYNNVNLQLTAGVPNITTVEDEISGVKFFDGDKTQLAANDKLTDVKYIGFVVAPDRKQVTADVYSTDVKITVAGIANPINGKLELTIQNPETISRLASYFEGDNVVAYGKPNAGKGAKFDVTELFEQKDRQWYKKMFEFKVEAGEGMTDADKSADKWTKFAEWTQQTEIEIAADQFYEKTAKVSVKVPLFGNDALSEAYSKNNMFKDAFFVTAKSPVKEGTITLNKTTLDLTAGTANGVEFTQADFVTKDVFNNAYYLFNTVKATTAAGKTTYAFDAEKSASIAKIADVTVTTNTNLVSIKFVKATFNEGAVTYTEADTYADATQAAVAGIKVYVGEGAAIQNGQEVKLTITIKDQWGQTATKEVSLNVKK